MVQSANTIWRDFEADGIPSSGDHDPKKSEIRTWGTWVEGIITAFTSNGGLVFTLRASLDAQLSKPVGTMAWVIGDPVVANNGIYQKIGVEGTGLWNRVADLPFSFIIASDAGAGTANAIQATTSIPVSPSALVWMNVFEANTSSPVSVSFNGEPALTIKTNAGNDVAVGGLVSGTIVMGIVSGSTFRLVSDQASAAVLAAAEAAKAVAEAARDEAVAAASSVQSEQASRAYAIASYHPLSAPTFIRVAGYAAGGDGGEALYKLTDFEPSHEGKMEITLNGGGGTVWYEIVPDGFIDPIAVGAVADGSEDDYLALAAAGTVSRHFNTPIRLRSGKIYAFGTALSFGKIAGIQGRGTLKWIGAPGDAVTIGGSPGSALLLSSDVARKSESLNIDGHGLSVEDWLWVRSGESCMSVSVMGNPQLGTEADDVRYSEWVQVDAITDANNVSLNGSTYYGYPELISANRPTNVYPIDVLQKLILKEFTFDAGDSGNFTIEYCVNPTVERSVICINPYECGLIVEHCIGGSISPTVLRDAVSDDEADPSRYQGVKLRDGCQSVSASPYVQNGEQGLDITYTPSSTMNGSNRNITAIGGVYTGVNRHPITSHAGSENCAAKDNNCLDCGDGVYMRSMRSRISGNFIRGRTLASGSLTWGVCLGNATANGSEIFSNDIENFEVGIYVIGTGTYRRDEKIYNNRVRECREGISITGKTATTIADCGLEIYGNTVVDCVQSGIVLGNNLNGSIVRDNAVRQELRGDLGLYCIRVGDGTDLTVTGNRGTNIGAAVFVVDLANNAKGKFANNTLIGSGKLTDTNAGAEFEFIQVIADDAVHVLPCAAPTVVVEISSAAAPGNGRASLASGSVAFSTGNANFATATGVLNGTSAVDGNFTCSYTGGNLYFQNRTGASASFKIKLICS